VQEGQARHAEWEERLARYEQDHPDLVREFLRVVAGELLPGRDETLPSFDHGRELAIRSASGGVLNAVAAGIPELVGGLADLAPPPTRTSRGTPTSPARTSPVGTSTSGAGARHGLGLERDGGPRRAPPLRGTFFAFSDYMRPAIRMAALMELPVVFVFTHDSIGLGEDGATHQPSSIWPPSGPPPTWW
jgi:transketolase